MTKNPELNKHNKKAKANLFGLIAGLVLAFFPKKIRKTSDKEALQKDFKTNTRQIGFVFTDKLRDIFRGRWIKKSK